jgi:NAD(P)-dependent dehydrogenase (short-subunit alcohol dehydrogenase family)
MTTRTAFITGANRGIGFEVARQLSQRGYRVILAARDVDSLNEAARQLASDVSIQELDLSRPSSVEGCVEAWRSTSIDILINNAGIYPHGGLLSGELSDVREAFEVHFFGVLRLCRDIVPKMLARGFGRVVNVSSGYGALSDGLEGPAAYSLSKAAMNALTMKLASELRGDVTANAVCPGWVRTRMGGASADLSVEEGADTITWLATHPAPCPNGKFFRERREIPW